MLRSHEDFLLLKPYEINANVVEPRFHGDIPPVTGLVTQIGSEVPGHLMNQVVVYFPTAGHPFEDVDGSQYIMLRHTNVLAYYDRTP